MPPSAAEIPLGTPPRTFQDLIFALQKYWAEQGCVIQMTGSALTGFWGDRTRRAAEWLLEHQAVHVLATDAHDLEKRVPILSASRNAAAEIIGEEVAEVLVEGNPSAIVNNQPLPYFPRPSAVAT